MTFDIFNGREENVKLHEKLRYNLYNKKHAITERVI